MTPTEVYESHGSYSGGAIELNDKLYLYYTGNVKYDSGDRSANQCLAIMDEKGNNASKFGINIVSSKRENLNLTFDRESGFICLNRKELINSFAEE
ncbi:hypothetical protein [Clostridium sp.]|uniref:hypothetical protein n=1 Tax=Clostridium sp. TaxID=1506 RepID=UPI0025BD3B7B|nr:hypothetical protein [Clostridium sp.]